MEQIRETIPNRLGPVTGSSQSLGRSTALNGTKNVGIFYVLTIVAVFKVH